LQVTLVEVNESVKIFFADRTNPALGKGKGSRRANRLASPIETGNEGGEQKLFKVQGSVHASDVGGRRQAVGAGTGFQGLSDREVVERHAGCQATTQ